MISLRLVGDEKEKTWEGRKDEKMRDIIEKIYKI